MEMGLFAKWDWGKKSSWTGRGGGGEGVECVLPGVGDRCDILVPRIMEGAWMPLFGRWRAEMTPLACPVCLGMDVDIWGLRGVFGVPV